jgi:hypothetical protein
VGSIPVTGQLSTTFITTIDCDIKRMKQMYEAGMAMPMQIGTIPYPLLAWLNLWCNWRFLWLGGRPD